MFTSISHKDDSSHKSGKSHCRKVKIEHVAPTKEDIQKKFDEQSFRHHISEQWADVKRKAFFVPSVIVKSVTSGEEPFMITKEVSVSFHEAYHYADVEYYFLFIFWAGNIQSHISPKSVFAIRPARALVCLHLSRYPYYSYLVK